jgi:hypothetical protein
MTGLALIAAAAFAAAQLAREACADDGTPAGAVEMKDFIVPDVALSTRERPFPYLALFAPADWTAEGALQPVAGDPCGVSVALRWRAASPDGRATIEALTNEVWTASRHKAQFSSCPSRAVFSAAEHAEELLARRGIRAATKTWRAREDIAALFRTPPTAGGETVADAIELLFRTETAMDGLLIAAVVISKPAPSIPEYEWRAYAPPSLLATAPAGALDASLIEAVRASAIVNPGWPATHESLFSAYPAPERKTIGARPPFPDRKTGAPTIRCGRTYAPLKTPHLWRRDDGRAYFIAPGNDFGAAPNPEQVSE